MKLGASSIDITPENDVWLCGYANRNRRSEGVYRPLNAGAIYLADNDEQALIICADVIGYDLAYAARLKGQIGDATGLLPRQIILTATHTHCAPFMMAFAMPGEIEAAYVELMTDRIVEAAVAAIGKAQPGHLEFSRGHSSFGVNRRRPNDRGGVDFKPNPDGPVDRDLDTLWLVGDNDAILGSLTVFACHPTSWGGYLVGGDYPGFLCHSVTEETHAPALFATGCAGDVRPWYSGEPNEFGKPSLADVEAAGRQMAADVLRSLEKCERIDTSDMHVDTVFHSLPYAELPTTTQLQEIAANHNDALHRLWANRMLELDNAGNLPQSCPQEIQLLSFNEQFHAFFLGGEILASIGLHLKEMLASATTMAVAYSNGLVAYVPAENTYDRGGYEVDGSHVYYLRPAPYQKDVEPRILAQCRQLLERRTQ